MPKRTGDTELTVSRDELSAALNSREPAAIAALLDGLQDVLGTAEIRLDQEEDAELTIAICAKQEDYEATEAWTG